MTSKDVIIVGAGLFGSIAATMARRRGHNVTVIDSGESWAASKCSGCVIAPSWLAALDRKDIDDGMAVLRENYAVHDVEFKTNLLKTFKATRVDTHAVLVEPDVNAVVAVVKNGLVVLEESGAELRGQVLIAAGLGTEHLVPGLPKMRGLWGSSMRFAVALPHPRIHVYAPYRQAVAFTDDRGTWFGDGTALVSATWVKESRQRVLTSISRAKDLMKLKGQPSETNVGARPYVEGHKAGYFAKVHPHTWASTGGAKNGTLLAAVQAARFIKEAKL